MQKNKFEYTYHAPSETEREEIRAIRRQFLPTDPTEISAIERLRKLNKKVYSVPTAISIALGVFGILIFGLGMSMALEWALYVWGAIVSAVGVVPLALAYPVYGKMTEHRKQTYGEEIVRLSDELLNIQDQTERL